MTLLDNRPVLFLNKEHKLLDQLSFDPGILKENIENEENVAMRQGRTLFLALARPVFLRSTIRGSRLMRFARKETMISWRKDKVDMHTFVESLVQVFVVSNEAFCDGMCYGTCLAGCTATTGNSKDIEASHDACDFERVYDALAIAEIGKVLGEREVVDEDSRNGHVDGLDREQVGGVLGRSDDGCFLLKGQLQIPLALWRSLRGLEIRHGLLYGGVLWRVFHFFFMVFCGR